MTVASELNHNQYVGNGVTTAFDYQFRIFKSSHLLVQVSDLNDVLTTLSLNTDYTVTGVGTNGGKVNLISPLATGWSISIDRNLPLVQETDLRNQGTFYAETHEDTFDYLTMLIQRVNSYFSLALRKPSWVSKYYDALGNRISNMGDPKNSQDGVTLNYFGKAVRVPEQFVAEVPSIELRKNKLFAWSNTGDPMAVLPESGSAADVLLELAKPYGSTLVYNGAENIAAQLNRLLTKTSNVFHVEAYGAKGTGVLSTDGLTVSGDDDTAAFTAAFAAAKAAGGGKVICSPGKTYLLTYTLLYPSNFAFDGQGCTLLFNPKNGNASLLLPETFQIADNTSYTTDVFIGNFTYLQPKNDTTPVQGNLLGVMKARRVLFEGVYTPYIYWHIFDGAGGKDCVVRRIVGDSGTTAAIQVDSSANGNGAAASGVDANGNMMLCAAGAADGTLSGFEYSENIYVTECVISYFQHSAIHIHGSGTRSIFIRFNKTNYCFAGVRSDANTSHNEIKITNNIFGNGTFGGYLMGIHNHIDFSENVIFSPGSSVANPYAYAVVANDGVTTGKFALSFNNNKINGYQRGLQVHNYTGVNASGNMFYGTGGGLPTSAVNGLAGAVGCIVCVDCPLVVAAGNNFVNCLVNACIIVKSGTEGTLIDNAVISNNVSRGSGPICVARYIRGVSITGNVGRMAAGSFYGIGDVLNTDVTISGNDVSMPDGQCGIYSSSNTPLVTGNNIRSALTTGYGIQFYAAISPRSAMNQISGFSATQQVYLDSTTSSGRHCEPFATVAKASGASGTNYTPSGTAL